MEHIPKNTTEEIFKKAQQKGIVFDNSKNEIEKATTQKELIEGASYIDTHIHQTDIAEETINIAKDVIGKLAHKNHINELILMKNEGIIKELQDAAQKERNFEEILKELVTQGKENTEEYRILKERLENQIRKTMKLEEQMNVPEGNLIDIDLENKNIEIEMKDKENALNENNAKQN